MSEAPSSPSEAIRLLFKVLGIAGIRIVPSYVAHDLANIRRARPDDEKFAAAVNAVAKEILLASKSPATFGVEVRHELEGWRRSKFASGAGGGAHLRLIFRPTKPAGIEILAFGDRAVPQSVYSTAKERT